VGVVERQENAGLVVGDSGRFGGDRGRADLGGRRGPGRFWMAVGEGRMVSEGNDAVFVYLGRKFAAPDSTRT